MGTPWRRPKRRHGGIPVPDTTRTMGVKEMTPAKLVAVCALLVVVAVTGRVQGTQEPEPGRETIVYSSIQPSNRDLYLFDGPGSEPRRLTTAPGLDYNGVVSPDGRWVVFTSERSGSPRPVRARPAGRGGAAAPGREPRDGGRRGHLAGRPAAALRQHAQRQRGHLRDAVPARGPARGGRGAEPDGPRGRRLQPRLLARRNPDSLSPAAATHR